MVIENIIPADRRQEHRVASAEALTISQSMVRKKGCVMMSVKPVSGWQPSLSEGFLLRKPLRMLAAFTDSDRGMRIGRSRITAKHKNSKQMF